MDSDSKHHESGIFRVAVRNLPIIVCAAVAVILSIFTVWTNDAVAYQYYSPVFDEFNARPINNLTDLWNSQTDHYMTTNGRFVVHLFVQLFCALLGKIPFAVCNGVMWFTLLYSSFRFIGFLKNPSLLLWFGVSAIWLTFLILPFDPPFQINYIWVAAVLCIWMKHFFKTLKFSSSTQGAVMYISSVICGSLHEGFTIPLTCALSLYLLIQYFKTRKTVRTQLLLTIFFALGTFVTAIAPGNFVRLDQITNAPLSSPLAITILLFIEEGFPVWITLFFFISLYLFCKRKDGDDESELQYNKRIFITLCLAAGVSLCICCIMGHLSRIALPASYFMVLATLLLLRERKLPSSVSITVIIAAVSLTGYKFIRQNDLNEMTRHITTEYHLSDNGIVYDSTGRILRNYHEITNFKWVYTKRERLANPEKPLLIVRPDIMRRPEFALDTNLMIQIADQSWILVQSKTEPATFYIDKVFLPGVLNKQMSPREVVFINNDDLVFDTIGPRRVGIYTNTRPYVRSSIRINGEKNCSAQCNKE